MNKTYPEPLRRESGCRVSFYYYADESAARVAAAIASAEGERMEANGYDFGFRCPGACRKTAGNEWEVVTP